MLPGVAPPGRGPPGRGIPGAGRGGTCGRGAGRSTGWADENGLLPTRGERGAPGRPGFGAAGPGRGPAAPGAAAGGGAIGAAVAAGGATGVCSTGAGMAGFGAVGIGDGAATGVTVPPSEGAATVVGASLTVACTGFAGALAGAFAGAFTGAFSAGFAPPNASRNRRATGASTVEEADLTNSPCSLRRARTSLLVTPSSLANSCTRALPATTSPVYEATAVVGRASGLATTHGHRLNFTVCSCSSLPVLLPGEPAVETARPPRRCPVNR